MQKTDKKKLGHKEPTIVAQAPNKEKANLLSKPTRAFPIQKTREELDIQMN